MVGNKSKTREGRLTEKEKPKQERIKGGKEQMNLPSTKNSERKKQDVECEKKNKRKKEGRK